MTELEWLKQESGLTDDELKTYETILGDGKFKAMLKKVITANEALAAAKTKAEVELEQFTTRYNSEFVPAMQDVTKQAIAKEGEAAALRAKLAKAKEFGIVIDDEQVADPNPVQTRAPGSPDPNAITREDFSRFSNAQANTIMALTDLNAEHFSLFGQPLGGTQELVAEVNRQHLLGNKGFTLKNAWETKFNVADKRKEAAAAAQKKHDEEIVAAALKSEREKNASNPNLRRGTTSRHSTYKPSDAAGAVKPWQSAHGKRERNADWRSQAVAAVTSAAA